MGMSTFNNGFSGGVSIRGLPLQTTHSGKVFYVNNSSVLAEGGVGGSNSNDGSYKRPFSTIDYAIGRCTAGRGDVILVMPSHAETITGAGGIALDVSGVSIIGLGQGQIRPTITFSTATAASITVTAANCLIQNMVFKCNIASQAHMIDVTAKDLTIKNCRFEEGTATGLFFVVADTADNDSDRLRIEECSFYAPTAGNYDAAIQLGKDFRQVRIIDCDVYGDYDNAAIEVPAGGNAQVDLRILNCRVDNTQTGIHAIEINSTTNTGMIAECYLQGDTLASIVDTGGLSLFETYVHDKADQSYAIVTGTAVS